ncbi:glycosyl hydrolase family 61-domain-containing protein [Mariannaea sp. PMI_226]|nr:glycosyl hydrolase family 61-domain-containing protein [Mariannaea sp. PMI_226]
MLSITALLGLVACIPQLVLAHGFVSGVKVNGVWTAGADPVWYYYPAGQAPATAGWNALNQDNGFVEPANFGTVDISCHKSATAGKNFINVNAGQTITFFWNTWPSSHKGPIINYIAPYNGETTAGTLSWSKISQSSIVSGTTWVTDNLIANNFSTSTTIPSKLKPGNYVIRHEIIALHSAQNDNGAQAYPQCLNLKVGGSGTVSPSGGKLGSALYTRLRNMANLAPRRFWFTPDLDPTIQPQAESIEALENAIRMSREVVASTPKDQDNVGEHLSTLADLLTDRFYRTGAMVDLEEAIVLEQEAIKATPMGHPERPLRINKLSIKFRSRYTQIGALADLDDAIHLAQETTDLTPDGHPNRLVFISNLINRLADRFIRTDEIDDLLEAIRLGEHISTIAPRDDPNRAVFLNNLAFALGERYSRDGEIEDLHDAIQFGEEAIKILPKKEPRRAKFLSNLGNHIGNRYLETMLSDDLNYAIRVSQEAVDATPSDDPNRAMLCHNLAIQFADQYLSTQAREDLEFTISYYKLALSQELAPPEVRIQAGRDIVRLYASVLEWEQAYEVAAQVTSLISQLTSRSLEIADKQDTLLNLAGFSSEAAAVALNAKKDPLVALKLLEEGRSVLVASLEDLRAETALLQEKHPELAAQFAKCRDKLEEAVAGLPVLKSYETAWKPEGSQRYEAGKQFDKVIAEIRRQPGFADFLSSLTEEEIHEAAKYGHIVVINTSRLRCDAIVVQPNQIRQISLPDLTVRQLRHMEYYYSMGSPKVLRWLWDVVVDPILAALNLTQTYSSGETWPHIWWIPTGRLSKFPIHAAGYHHKGMGKTVLDRTISSYSSSIKTLIHTHRRRFDSTSAISPRSTPKALLIAMEKTPGYASLPFAGKEASIIGGLLESMEVGVAQPLPHKQDILSELRECTILHFAGHGSNNIDPSRSHLVLEDSENPLYVADLLEVNIRDQAPLLAYLSACGTGEIEDEKYSDESIHLISACQLAGFRHVIGTLWEVNDEMCVEMAKRTYETIGRGGLTDESVSLGLHNAVREMRDEWLSNRRARQGMKRGGSISEEAVVSSEEDIDEEDTDEGANEEGTGEEENSDSERSEEMDEEEVDEDEMDEQLYNNRNERNASLMGTSKTKGTDAERLRWVPYVHYGI